MPDTFNPYYEWLGIQPKDQPPNHYRLLGIERFEENPNVIDRAADRQMAHIRTFQAGPHGRESQVLLNQIAAARLCLLDPQRKEAYDAALRDQQVQHALSSSDDDPTRLDGTIAGESLPPIAFPAASADSGPPVPLPEPAVPELAVPELAAPESSIPDAAGEGARLALPHPQADSAVAIAPSFPQLESEDVPAARIRKRVRRTPWWRRPLVLVIAVGIAALIGVLYMLVTTPADSTTAQRSEPIANASRPAAVSPAARPPSEQFEGESQNSEVQNPQERDGDSAAPLPQPKSAANSGQPAEDAAPTPLAPLPSLIDGDMTATVSPSGPLPREEPLRFGGRDRVQISETRGQVDPDRPFTVEVWLRLDPQAPSPGHYFLGNGVMKGFHPSVQETGLAGWLLMAQSVSGERASGSDTVVFRTGAPGSTVAASGQIPALAADWHHLAVTNDPALDGRWHIRVFVDGVTAIDRVFDSAFPSPANLHLGSPAENAPGLQFHGEIRGFRLSPRVRYTGTFSPPATFHADSDGVTVLDFSADSSDKISALGNSQHRGQITGAEWVESSAATAGVVSPTRQVIPPAEELRIAERRLASDYEVLIASAKTAAAKVRVGGDLLEDALQQEQAALQFVSLDKCRQLAEEAVDPHLLNRVLDELSTRFAVEPWERKADSLKAMHAAARTDMQRQTVANAALAVALEARKAEAFDIALRLLQLARRSKNAATRQQATEDQREVSHDRRMFLAALAARKTLETDPDDRAAKTTVGKYLSLRRSDWEKGLSLLARGNDAALAELAQQDLNHPETPTARLALADAWQSWARTAPNAEQNGARIRAQHWYRQALPDLTDQQKAAAESKLEELADQIRRRTTAKLELTLLDGEPGYVERMRGHEGVVMHLSAPPTGTHLISAATDNTIRVWDLSSCEELRAIEPGVNAIRGLGLSPDGRVAIVGGSTMQLETWHVGSGAPIPPGIRVAGYTSGLEVSRSGKLLWTSNSGPPDNLRLLDLTTGATLLQLTCPTPPVAHALSPSGRYVLAADRNDALHIWMLAGGAVRPATLPGISGTIHDIAVSPDEQLVAACTDLAAVIWDTQSGRQVQRLVSSDETFHQIAFSHDSRRLYASSQSRALSIWDPRTGQRADRLMAPGAMITPTSSLTVLADPRGVVTGDRAGAIHLWRVE